MNTIQALFEKQAQCMPQHIAAISNQQSITYDELNKKANRLAHYLINLGIKAETPVAISMERSIDYLITILGILKAGGAYLPIDSEQPEERLLFILENSKSAFLITKNKTDNKLSTYPGHLIVLTESEQLLNSQPNHNPDLQVRTKQLAYIIYTSGSTGTPKGVLIEHQSVINYCTWFFEYSALEPKQRIDFSSNPCFDMSVSVSIVPLMLGLTVVLCDDATKKNIRLYLHHLKQSQVQLIKLTPSFFKLMAHEATEHSIDLPQLTNIILGGENLLKTDCKTWLKLYPQHKLHNEYGPTEATVAVTSYSLSNSDLNQLGTSVPIGKAGYQMQCFLLDEHHQPVKPGEIGELYLGGICLARGYLNQEPLTKKQFIQYQPKDSQSIRLYKTGDLCKQNADGLLEYLGRIDEQIKIRGFRIEPGEIEQHLLAHASVESVVVLAQKDSLNEDRLIAYYTLKDSHTAPSSRQLRDYLQNHLPDYMIPTAYIKLDSFPLTANGKLNKSLLPTPEFSSDQKYQKPKSSLEKTLAQIWSEELGIPSIGINDDFFELGGHSLTAARIISKISRIIQKEVSMRDFYTATSISKLARLIKKIKTAKKAIHTAAPLGETFYLPLSNFQFLLWLSNTFEPKARKLNITFRTRLQGQLDSSALKFAFKALLSQQEVLSYCISKYKPEQNIQEDLNFNIMEINLSSLSERETESLLETSMKQLANYYPWPQKQPLLRAKLFYLNHDEVELQIGLPHMISDDSSPDIFFSNLSRFYLLYLQKNHTDKPVIKNTQYKEYLLKEQEDMQKHLDQDVHFWEDYLKDAGLFIVPEQQLMEDRSSKNLPYSTYTKIPQQHLNTLKTFCSNHHLSIIDGLSAAVAQALCRHTDPQMEQMPYLLMNLIKSRRTSDLYDNSIGCFLRLEPIKIRLNKQSELKTLAEQIHQATKETSLHQNCPDLIKLSSIGNINPKKTRMKTFLMQLATSIYSKMFSIRQPNRNILKYTSNLRQAFEYPNQFLVNINVHRNFIAEHQNKERNLFGLTQTPLPGHHDDLLRINNILDVCFVHHASQNTPSLVISSRLKPEFRKLLAAEIIRIMAAAPEELIGNLPLRVRCEA